MDSHVLPELPASINFISQYTDITSGLEQQIETIARNHLLKFQTSYLKPYLHKPDAQVIVTMYFSKNKQERYEGKFKFVFDSEEFYRTNDIPFKEPLDLVNHAFQHLKEYLADK
ncbi:MAG: hypothetical protein Q8O99_00815 [bacterium]|nr:hypothetical protein [bacterium]